MGVNPALIAIWTDAAVPVTIFFGLGTLVGSGITIIVNILNRKDVVATRNRNDYPVWRLDRDRDDHQVLVALSDAVQIEAGRLEFPPDFYADSIPQIPASGITIGANGKIHALQTVLDCARGIVRGATDEFTVGSSQLLDTQISLTGDKWITRMQLCVPVVLEVEFKNNTGKRRQFTVHEAVFEFVLERPGSETWSARLCDLYLFERCNRLEAARELASLLWAGSSWLGAKGRGQDEHVIRQQAEAVRLDGAPKATDREDGGFSKLRGRCISHRRTGNPPAPRDLPLLKISEREVERATALHALARFVGIASRNSDVRADCQVWTGTLHDAIDRAYPSEEHDSARPAAPADPRQAPEQQ